MSSPRSIARAAARGKQPARQDNAASTRNLRTITGRVYVASSLSTYDTDRYDQMVESVREHFPHADLLPARDQFTSNADWRRRWPGMLPTLQAVVFFDDGEGWIGRGVLEEITTAQRAGLPVFYLTDCEPLGESRLMACDDRGTVQFTCTPDNWAKAARIEYAISGADLAAMVRGGY